jgi:replication-associated recombination protein RarA
MDKNSSKLEDVGLKTKMIPWVEKYRPKNVDEISHQNEVIRTLKNSVEQGNLPHLLFHGPPGTVRFTISSNKISSQSSVLILGQNNNCSSSSPSTLWS